MRLLTLRKDAEAAYRQASIAEAALAVAGPWGGSPVFDRDRADALAAVRRIIASAREVLAGTGDEP